MKNILITGGAGFIGSNLANILVKKGYNVIVLDNLSPQIHGIEPKETSPLYKSLLNNPAVQLIEGTVTSREDWKVAISQADAIVHLAAETGTGQSMYEIQKYTDVNVGGTALILDILANEPHVIQKVIVASSRAIYGEGKYLCPIHGNVYPWEREEKDMQNADFECKCPICKVSVQLVPTTEDSLIHPTSVYGITKQNQEQMVLTVCKSLGIDAIAFRYQNVYGPGQSLSNPYTGILSIFSTQIKNNHNINIFEDGQESRDFVYIDDVVNATILGLETPSATYQSFNIGTGVPINVLTVANALVKNYNSNVEIRVSGNYRLGDIRHNYADITLASKILKYQPTVDFTEGIAKFCAWVNTQEISQDNYQKSINEMKNKGLYK